MRGWVPGEEQIAWSGDGRALYVRKRAELPSRVHRLDLDSGKKELWKQLMPADPAGVLEILNVVLTPDARFYAYSYISAATELYVVRACARALPSDRKRRGSVL